MTVDVQNETERLDGRANAELAFRVQAKPCPRETLILAIEDVLTRWSVGEA